MINDRDVWNVDSWAWMGYCIQTQNSYNYLHRISTALSPMKFCQERGLLRGIIAPWQQKIRKRETFASVANPLTKCYAPVKNSKKTNWFTKEFIIVEIKLVGKMKGIRSYGSLAWNRSGEMNIIHYFILILLKWKLTIMHN